MLALLNDQPILVLMATVALGAAVGTIPQIGRAHV